MQLKHVHLQKNRRLWVVLTLWATVSVRCPKLPPRHHRSAPWCGGTHPHPPAGCREVFLSQHSSALEQDEYLVLRRLGFLNSCKKPLIKTCLVGFHCLLSFIVDLTVSHSFTLGISSLRISISFFYFLFQSCPKLQTVDYYWLDFCLTFLHFTLHYIHV